jgi:hypothetical protein
MRIKWLFALFLLLSVNTFADQPPSWKSFTVNSENGNWSALIYPIGDSTNPRDDNWEIAVYKGRFHPSKTPSWESKYLPSGYSGGYLSNDGKIFSYVEYWFYENRSVVDIYLEHCRIRKNGSFFEFKTSLEKTVSHQLWRKIGGKVSYVEKDNKPHLAIDTVEGKKYIKATCEKVT